MTQLVDASVELRQSDLVLRFIVSDPPPGEGVWTLATTFTGGDDGPVDHVGFKVLDDRVIATWSFDLSDGVGQRNYLESPQRVGDRWTLVLPKDAIRSVSGTWRAGLDIEGQDAGHIEGSY